jgi:hypothetical protein
MFGSEVFRRCFLYSERSDPKESGKDFFQDLEKRSRKFPTCQGVALAKTDVWNNAKKNHEIHQIHERKEMTHELKKNSRIGFLCIWCISWFAIFLPNARADFVTIGGTGVAADSTGYGAVNYTYGISRYEVTGAEFDAAVAADSRVGGCSYDTANGPAYYVSWYEAAMYCNWLTSGDAYLGAYQFDGSGTFAGTDRASAISTYGIIYALPTEDEWYKAAYWTGNESDLWSLYANGTDTTPTWGTTEGWNYRDATYGYAYGIGSWAVGYGAQEQNGTYDMMGNVWEWTETMYDASRWVARGGGTALMQQN